MKRFFNVSLAATFALLLCASFAQAQTTPAPVVRIDVPERLRLLTNQYFDLRIEAENLSSVRARVQVTVQNEAGQNEAITNVGGYEVTSDNDNNPATLDRAYTYRKMSFATPGIKTIQAVIIDGRRIYGSVTQIQVQDFNLQSNKNIVLFIGDAMGTAYRDAGRIVAQSTNNRFREGYFDELQQMDQMPVTGMSMTYALDQITPDSANTATAWASGNKTINGALNVFPDNNDFKYNASNQQATKQYALDNPRVETFWEYLKRRHGYKTGIVSTADITDATPAGEGSHTVTRSLLYDIAKQYVDGSINSGAAFDVILGGGKEKFDTRTATNSGDTRNLAAELQAKGFRYVQTRTELNQIDNAAPPARLLGLFRTGNMNVAYDKLALTRPADENVPTPPSLGTFTDQPFLDEMTTKAVATLSNGGTPFILMVEGASIDKQSHPNYANGQIWDTIEFDKSVGVARSLLSVNAAARAKNLVIVTADHDQSMSIIGAVDTTVAGAVQNVNATQAYPNANRGQGNVAPENRAGETAGFPDYADANNDRYPENGNNIRIKVGYRTGDHTGSSVPVTAEGAGALLFYGYYDQTDIFFKMAKVLSTDTQALDQAITLKSATDVAPFAPALRPNTLQKLSKDNGGNIVKNPSIVQPHLITDAERDSLDEQHNN